MLHSSKPPCFYCSHKRGERASQQVATHTKESNKKEELEREKGWTISIAERAAAIIETDATKQGGGLCWRLPTLLLICNSSRPPQRDTSWMGTITCLHNSSLYLQRLRLTTQDWDKMRLQALGQTQQRRGPQTRQLLHWTTGAPLHWWTLVLHTKLYRKFVTFHTYDTKKSSIRRGAAEFSVAKVLVMPLIAL